MSAGSTIRADPATSDFPCGTSSESRLDVGYVIVSPVKNEERWIERTLQSVASQSLRPLFWVIVDDGSTDQTPALIASFAHNRPWVRVVRRPAGSPRQPGSAVIQAFAHGLRSANDVPCGFLVKLDCDLELPADYFERILRKFERNPRLGIASGVYLEQDEAGGWAPIPMPAYHAAGACKVIRWQCYKDIGGFVPERGWDTVDEVRAQTRGWVTQHFPDLPFRHLKPEGSGIGTLRTSRMHGEVFYLTGGGTFFLALKAAHRALTGRPPVIAGAALLWGYLRLRLAGRPTLLDANETRHYRRLLRTRLRTGLAALFHIHDSSADSAAR